MTSHVQRQVAPRFDTIDLLRGLAVLGVVLLHVSILFSTSKHPVGQSLPPWLHFVVLNSGGNGVSTYFAISGFLITLISIRRFGNLSFMDPKAFYRIRFARIAPLLVLLLCVLSVLHLASVPHYRIKSSVGTLPQALFAALTFQVNWFEAVRGWLPAHWTVLWTLSVEEMFYLFFPLFCIVLLKRSWGVPAFVSLLSGFIIFGPFARTPCYTTNDMWGYQSYLGNVDNIALGCLFAMLADRIGKASRLVRSKWPLVLKLVGAAMMLFIVFWVWPKVIFGWHIKHDLARSGTDVTVIGFGACLVMLGSVLRPTAGSFWTAPLRWLGRCSYEIYLTHEFAVVFVHAVFLRVHRGALALWICVVVVLAGFLGFLLARFVSEPANRALRGAPISAELHLKRAARLA